MAEKIHDETSDIPTLKENDIRRIINKVLNEKDVNNQDDKIRKIFTEEIQKKEDEIREEEEIEPEKEKTEKKYKEE